MEDSTVSATQEKNMEQQSFETRKPSEFDELNDVEVNKPQQFKRAFGFWSLLGLSMPFMATWMAVLFTNPAAMINGGPPTLVYGFFYGWLGSLATVASLAEMASIYPTSGGQYFWTSKFASARHQAWLSWLTAWMSVLGWIANTCSGAFIAAVNIQGLLVQIQPSYHFERWHGTLMAWGVLLVAFLVNSIGTRLLALVEGGILVLYIAAFPAVLIPLVYFSPHGSATDVFVTFKDRGGWGSDGLAFFAGFISCSLPFIGLDGPAHMAEETRHASSTVPRAMVGTVVLNGLIGWGMAIALSFCILPTFESAINTPTGFDYIPVFYTAAGRAGAAGLVSLPVATIFFGTFGGLATTSRQLWALARDRGMPFSEYFSHINTTLAIPLRAVVICTIIPCLLLLINIGSTTAFNALISLATASLFISYLIPITLFLIQSLQNGVPERGPWSMGKMDVFINVFAMIFLIIAIVFSFFPLETPVTPVSMNWSCAVFGGFIIIGVTWYATWGRRTYNGPRMDKISWE